MALKLNNIFVWLWLLALPAMSQEERPGDKDYKDPEQFERFAKRRKLVAAWQIGQLKQGALVVRLKTNQLLIDGLKRQGNEKMAEEKRLETDAINLNTVRAYLANYNFSKLYFIYSNSSDTLLNGARSGIFLDSTLRVDPAIEMKENFYLLAERDYEYNSSIGFVPEDSARMQLEQGNALKERAVIVKNKYGHQLKRPFPYDIPDAGILDRDDSPGADKKKKSYIVYISIQGITIPFNVGDRGPILRGAGEYKVKDKRFTLYIPKALTYDYLSKSLRRLNASLQEFYRSGPYLGDNLPADVRPFLY